MCKIEASSKGSKGLLSLAFAGHLFQPSRKGGGAVEGTRAFQPGPTCVVFKEVYACSAEPIGRGNSSDVAPDISEDAGPPAWRRWQLTRTLSGTLH